MIVVDTSVIVAILGEEPDAKSLAARIVREGGAILPATCYLEAAMVASRIASYRLRLDAIIEELRLEMHPIDEVAVRLAADAFERYGKGRGHPARLNFGDCLSYAVAKARQAPLLFKGNDFLQTDIVAAT